MADALQWLSGLRAGRLALVALVAAAGTAGALSWQVQRSDTSPQLDSRNPAATVAADTDGSTVPGTERPTLVVVPDDDGPPARLAIAGEEVPDGTEPDADPPDSTDPGPAPTDAPTGDEMEASTTTPDPTTPTPVARTGARFATLPPGSTLPSGAACAARVRPTPENVPENRPYNQARGRKPTGTYLSTNAAIGRNDYERRLDGDFVGTTDEIIQWAACKWGFDEDLVRAQVYAESSWYAGKLGDCGENTQDRTGGQGGCASVGLAQIRSAEVDGTHHPGVYPAVLDSSAMNLDYALAVKRLCFEGLESWLAQSAAAPGGYVAGDEWNCMGRWFSGRFGDEGARNYLATVRAHLDARPWESRHVGCPNWKESFHCSGISR